MRKIPLSLYFLLSLFLSNSAISYISAGKTLKSKISLFNYIFDSSVTNIPNNDFTLIGSPYLQFTYRHDYKPNPSKVETLTVTDYTSISIRK